MPACISTSQQQQGSRPRPSRGRLPKDLDSKGQMERKLRSNAGQAFYTLRKSVVKPLSCQIKWDRGRDRFRLRGLDKANGEWDLMATPTTSSSSSGKAGKRDGILLPC